MISLLTPLCHLQHAGLTNHPMRTAAFSPRGWIANLALCGTAAQHLLTEQVLGGS